MAPVLLAGLAIAGLALWLFLAWRQIAYPLELFGHEGAIVDHVRRLLDGQPLYGPPELEFVPFLYTPGYYLVCAALAWTGDLAFVVPRGVSAAATLGSMACLALLVRRLGGSLVWSAVAVGAFALAASRVEAWYALAQVDNLFLFCLALAVTTGQFADNARRFLLVGLIFAAAFWCKQIGLAAGVLYAATMALLDGRRSLAILAGMGMGIAPGVVLLQHESDGWFGFYAFAIPAHFGLQPLAFLAMLARDVPWLAPSFLLALFVLWRLWREGRREPALQLAALALCLFGTAALGRSHPGGHVNTLLPAMWLMALGLGAGVGMVWQGRISVAATPAVRTALAGLVLLQLGLLSYDPRRFLPAANGEAVRAEIGARLAAAPQPMLLPGMGYLVGRVAGADPMAVNDVYQADAALRRRYLVALEAAMREKRYASVVLDEVLSRGWAIWYDPYYRQLGRLSADGEALRPRAGLDFGPPVLLEAR